MLEREKSTICFKVVRKTPEGNLVSAVVGEQVDDLQYVPLKYSLNNITRSPEGTLGCVAFSTARDARKMAISLGPNREVYKARGYMSLPLPKGIDFQVVHPRGWINAEGEILGDPTPVNNDNSIPKLPPGSVVFREIELLRLRYSPTYNTA